jgi:hypothetical protein
LVAWQVIVPWKLLGGELGAWILSFVPVTVVEICWLSAEQDTDGVGVPETARSISDELPSDTVTELDTALMEGCVGELVGGGDDGPVPPPPQLTLRMVRHRRRRQTDRSCGRMVNSSEWACFKRIIASIA